MLTSIESRFMQAALLEGRKALPLCLPNPPVGCVPIKDGEIIARGHTQPPGMNHAEAMALAQISGDLAPIVWNVLPLEVMSGSSGLKLICWCSKLTYVG